MDDRDVVMGAMHKAMETKEREGAPHVIVEMHRNTACAYALASIAESLARLTELSAVGQGAGAPEPAEQPAPLGPGVPDNRTLVFAAQTEGEFDHAVFRLLRGAVFHDVERVAFVRRSIAAAWKPSERTNRAMWIALETYHEKRGLAAGWGEAETAAHQFARREAVTAYNNAIKG